MSEEPRAARTLDERVIGTLASLASLLVVVVVLWERLDPDGPSSAFEGARDRFRDWRRTRHELEQTLEQIQWLPELDDELERDVDEASS